MKKTVIETKTVIINTKTNEQFVSSEESINVDLNGSSKAVITLTRADGTTKEVAASTFKRWYKTTEIQVETEVEVETSTFEKPKAETKHQQKAISNIEGAYCDIVGGYENSVQDEYISEMPPIERMFEEVYANAMDSAHMMFGGLRVDGGSAPVCMRFAGKTFVKKYIAYLFNQQGYEVPENLYNTPEHKGHRVFPNRAEVNVEDLAKDEVIMRAFTGMYIGVFKIADKTKEVITVELRDGSLMEFDAYNGVQLHTDKPQFGNHIYW